VRPLTVFALFPPESDGRKQEWYSSQDFTTVITCCAQSYRCNPPNHNTNRYPSFQLFLHHRTRGVMTFNIKLMRKIVPFATRRDQSWKKLRKASQNEIRRHNAPTSHEFHNYTYKQHVPKLPFPVSFVHERFQRGFIVNNIIHDAFQVSSQQGQPSLETVALGVTL
jgi:hypothetical protein